MVIIRISFIAALMFLHLFAAPVDVSIKGVVNDGTTGIEGAGIYLQSSPTLKTTSGADGAFELKGQIEQVAVAPFNISVRRAPQLGVKGNCLYFTIASPARCGNISFFTGNGRRSVSVPLGKFDAGSHQKGIPPLATGFYFMYITIDGITTVCKLVATGSGIYVSPTNTYSGTSKGLLKSAAAAAIDTVVAEKSGFTTKKVAIESYTKENITITLKSSIPSSDGKEAGCTEPLPSSSPSSYTANSKFPDPFKMKDGSRMSKKNQWCEQRAYLSSLLQATSLGEKPPKPDKVTASYSEGKLTINCTVGSTTKSFSVTISGIPSGDGPFPALIGLGGAFQIGAPSGVAKISYFHNTIASQSGPSSRGSGLFYELYGKNHSAGAMMAWAWGASRILDGLELCSETKINPYRCAITGCSRDGKGAMVCGVFDERMALTLPMEGGSGGISSWRIAKVENSNKSAHPDGCQTASQIVGENVWLSPNFNQFANGDINKLPTDAHTLAAICAPRGIYFVEGSQNSWNCNVCCWTAASAAQMVYEALGIKSNIGIVMTNHGHCSLNGSKEKEAWNAFIKKFLLDDAGTTTDYFSNDGSFDKLIDFTKWIDWTAPTLE